MDSGSGHVENNKLTFLKELCFASGFVPSYIFTSVHFLATSMDSKDSLISFYAYRQFL